MILTEKKLLEKKCFAKKKHKNKFKKKFRIEKVIKRKINKLYIKWKGFDSSFESWIGKKDIV